MALLVLSASADAQDATAPEAATPKVNAASEPARSGVHCGEQVKPYLPRAARAAGIQGTVEATVLIQDGAVLDVLSISGPPALQPSVILALARYKCDRVPRQIVATQQFDFRVIDAEGVANIDAPIGAQPASKIEPNAHEELAARLAKQIEADKSIIAGQRRMVEAVDAEVQNFLATMNGVKLPDDVRADLNTAIQEYKTNLTRAWSSKSAMDLYVKDLAQILGDAEISNAIAFYSTPSGAKTMQALQHANSNLDQYVSAKLQRVGEQEGQALAARLLELRARVLKADPNFK